MRALFSTLTILAATALRTNALQALIYTFEANVIKQDLKPLAISGATFQQLLDLRSTSATTSNLGRVDEDSVEFLSKLSGVPSPLFDAPTIDWSPDTFTVILEGLDSNHYSSIQSEYQGVEISIIPTENVADTYFESFLESRREQMRGLGSNHCLFYGPGSASSGSEKGDLSCFHEAHMSQNFGRTLDSGLFNFINIGEYWINKSERTLVLRVTLEHFTNSNDLSTYVSGLNSLFADLRSLELAGKKSTAVVLPSSDITRKSYSRRALEENKVDSTIKSIPVIVEQPAKIPPTLAPICYASNSTCTDTTNSCSGHGVCYKKSGSGGDCYACRCHETIVKNEDGTERLVRWGGSACQKKDISSPFLLISGVTIAIFVIVGTAIGMIYSVGTVELPGVISAGVGAPRAQK
ncbi:hypothetical protein BJX64DRAFT_294929 [Aspergillus heterothallicus]